MEIRDKVAVITGGASGIGRATAMRLAAEGARIVIADLDEAMGKETVRAIESAGGRAALVKADVIEADDARRMLDVALSKFGRLDILHNNAGISVGPPGFPTAALDRWRRVVAVDLQAVILGCYLAAPLMEQRGGGVIISTASMAGIYPYPNDPIYAAAKAGVVHLTYALASWAQTRKIRVNCLCPGIVDTPMVRRGVEAQRAAGQIAALPAKMIQPAEIADAFVSLVRDDTLAGCALEIRPSGRRFVEPSTAPGTHR